MKDSILITNDSNKKLGKRISELIKFSEELKFLIGFFYFSGIQELYESLKANQSVQIKVLVGLNVDRTVHGLFEYADDMKGLTGKEKFDNFLTSISKSINSDDFDTKEFYEQSSYFINAIIENRLILRKTHDPNHAKLYIFKVEEEYKELKKSSFIVGSSNLTKSGLYSQGECNVEIGDYGTEEAEEYFDGLWEDADKITENDVSKQRLIHKLKNGLLTAEVTPYEAFALILKIYIDLQKQKKLRPSLLELLEKGGYKTYTYQLDAVAQALSILEQNHGVIISDVVGLGKSIMAGMIANSLGKRGIIICPPGLIGDDNANSGWTKYREDFELHDWKIRSCGLENLEKTLALVNANSDYEVIIIDEVHRFRNQDTEAYELLSNICRGKKVIMLTATPFNNTPADIFSLLKLFVVPGKSSITLTNDLPGMFRGYNSLFKRLSNIRKNYNSLDKKKRSNAVSDYEATFGSNVVDLSKVRERARYLARNIRSVIAPVMIRRNRIDLKKDPIYSKEIYELSDVNDPRELFFELTEEQSQFYDKVLNEYFGEAGQFTGAIYQPFIYDTKQPDLDEGTLSEEKNREKLIQKNLYDFMRRLLVKRFESSFGSFKQSIENFKSVTEKVKRFIEISGGQYILDRPLLENIYKDDIDEIEEELQEYAERIAVGNYPKHHKVYKVNSFHRKDDFLSDIQSDIDLFEKILGELDSLGLVNNDPKLHKLTEELARIIKIKYSQIEPERKVIIFTEYADTVKYLEGHLKKAILAQSIIVKGALNKHKADEILKNFDITSKEQENNYKLLITTDKMSEGYNLNRAGAVINYDIPWNPTRVIQRVGRINRISRKVFDNLYIYNFFPTIQGATYVRSREIATEKMFMIHNTLGEDAKMFEIDEEPSPSRLFKKIMENPERLEEESFQTKIRQMYADIRISSPDVIEKINELPARIKVIKGYSENNLVVFIKKGLGLFIRSVFGDSKKVDDLIFENALKYIECSKDEEAIPLSKFTWENYYSIKDYKDRRGIPSSELSIEKKARNNVNALLKSKVPELESYLPFIRNLREDILEYKTLSDYTLRRLAKLNSLNKDKARIQKTIVELEQLKKDLGDNYLEKIKTKLGKLDPEVIIAVQNMRN